MRKNGKSASDNLSVSFMEGMNSAEQKSLRTKKLHYKCRRGAGEMKEILRKHGLWAVCFTVFVTVVLMMTFGSANDREAGAEDGLEDTEATEENTEDEAVNEDEEEAEAGDGTEEEEAQEEEEDPGRKEDGMTEETDSGHSGDMSDEDAGDQAAVTEAEAVAYQEGMEIQAKAVLENAHDYLNKITGWGRIDNVIPSELVTTPGWHKLREDQLFLESQGFAPSAAKRDVERAGALIRLVETEEDKQALLLLHRVLHDLDIHVNESEGQHFGVTEAFGNESAAEEAAMYAARYTGSGD
ncbi:hypothetical protein [Alteribacter natronophilus]|uniref:hypothetical protein n=1 Tax=Alteribacter natronophilus TaxID=2583810 RepID=UPI00110D5F61|nr:hypothetical protein [Alteribacter natronophilus]TMW70689.1 hypothetical protein FGB90_16025 [Alteribacter natronophilus]